MDGDTMRVDEISPEDFYRQPKEASMTDKIDTSTLGRMGLSSGGSPAPIEECVSTWAVDERIQSLIADNERLRGALQAISDGTGVDWAHKPTNDMQDIAAAALS